MARVGSRCVWAAASVPERSPTEAALLRFAELHGLLNFVIKPVEMLIQSADKAPQIPTVSGARSCQGILLVFERSI